VDKHVLPAVIANDETETLLAIEELDRALGLADDLRGHPAPAAAATTAEAIAAATETAATTTAEAIAAAAISATATAETIAAAVSAAATEAVTTATVTAATTEAVLAKAVALIPAAALTAPPSIETHAVKIFPTTPLFMKADAPGGHARTLGRRIMPHQLRLLQDFNRCGE
jgi:hypothetical protein